MAFIVEEEIFVPNNIFLNLFKNHDRFLIIINNKTLSTTNNCQYSV